MHNSQALFWESFPHCVITQKEASNHVCTLDQFSEHAHCTHVLLSNLEQDNVVHHNDADTAKTESQLCQHVSSVSVWLQSCVLLCLRECLTFSPVASRGSYSCRFPKHTSECLLTRVIIYVTIMNYVAMMGQQDCTSSDAALENSSSFMFDFYIFGGLKVIWLGFDYWPVANGHHWTSHS